MVQGIVYGQGTVYVQHRPMAALQDPDTEILQSLYKNKDPFNRTPSQNDDVGAQGKECAATHNIQSVLFIASYNKLCLMDE